MAMNYQNFASLGVNLNRQTYGPLDISNVFTSEADLKYYLTKGTFTEGVSEYWYKNATEKIVPYPYEGQVLATVIDGVVNVYALSLDAEGNFQTQEIGAKVEVDGKTIKLNTAGKLELVGLPADITGKTLVPSLVNGELTWAEPDTSTAEGQAREIEGLKARATALETTVNGKLESSEGAGDAVVGLVDKVAALEAVDNATQAELNAYKEEVTAAIAAGVAEAKKYADDNDTDTVYDDTALSNRVKTLEDKPAYDETPLANRVTALETTVGSAEAGLVKSVADNKTAIEAEVARATAKEEELAQAIAAIDFIDSDELNKALEPINTALATKAAKSDLEALKGRVDAFLTGTGTEAALDSLQELIEYINTHDDADINGILASIQAIENKLEGIDSTVVAYVTAAIEALKIGDYAKAADLTALAGRVEALEAKPFDTYATKTEVEAVDAKFADYTKTSDLNNALSGKVSTSDFDTFKSENTSAISTAKSEAIAAAAKAVEDAGYAVASDVAETYATKTSLTEAVEGIETDLLTYAKTTDVNAELAKKIETGSIAHSSESLTEGVTVDGTKLNIVVDAYTKQEVRDYVAEATGGKSAAEVLTALNNYKSDNDTRVGAIETKNTEQDTAIAAAKTQADKGVADAAKVAADLATANLAIAENTRQIGVVDGKIDTVNNTLSKKITALEGKDATIEGNITALQTLTNGHTTTITEHGTKITALENKDTELATLIQGNTNKFADYSTTTQMNKAIDDKIAAIPDVDLSDYAKSADVEATYAKIGDAYTKAEADAEFMTEGEVDARINALIVAADPEGGKVITNIQNLVQYVDENAGEIAALVTATNANTAKLAGIDTTVTAYVDDALATLATRVDAIEIKESSEISIAAADGTTGKVLGIKEVNVNKLVQTEGDILILNGGSAAV